VAEFTASSTSIVKGNAVTFSDQSTGEPTTWSWTFTGGTPASSASQNPAVTYNSAGTYNVSLTVSNGAGSDTKTKTGYIIVTNPAGGALDADFSTPATTIVTHQTITFTDQSSGSPVSWLWSFTNGTPATSTAQNPQVKWGQQGAFTVSLTVTDAAGGTSTETKSQYILAAANLLFWKNFDGPNVKVYACPMPGTPYNASQPTVNLKGTITSYQSSAPSCGATSGWVSTIAQGFINYYCLEEGTGRHWSGNNYDVPTGSCANIGLTNANAD
jgi:PKD repeat protein